MSSNVKTQRRMGLIRVCLKEEEFVIYQLGIETTEGGILKTYEEDGCRMTICSICGTE